MSLEGFDEGVVELASGPRPIFYRGTGPGVVIMHEVPGITTKVAAFARRVADAGFRVALPSLFGHIGRDFSQADAAYELSRACVRREFAVLARNETSPIVRDLIAVARKLHLECGGRGVGALGMCLTGNFALAMAIDPSVCAPVLSQPSLPLPITPSHRAALHVSPAALRTVRERTKREGLRVVGCRFTRDPAVPAARFDTLRRELGDAFEAIEIDSSSGNPHGIPRAAHSVLTEHLVDVEGHPTRAALDRILTFFRQSLA